MRTIKQLWRAFVPVSGMIFGGSSLCLIGLSNISDARINKGAAYLVIGGMAVGAGIVMMLDIANRNSEDN